MSLELMSPAGNLDSFLAAISNGADSVYLGLKKFNARRPARNFSFYQFKKAIEFAHSLKKKVYLALNIDLKSNEIKDAVEMIEFADQCKIDGIIIKDPTLLYIMKQFYSTNIYFSTQNAVESSAGVEFVKSLGVKRVVLARELDLEEITKCASISGIEIEIFTEGSMCFSISGRCLMSSWVGGRSGNRGGCTAPCRILWEKDGKDGDGGAFFSMKDLNLITELGRIKNTGVSSLKIEGRLKNANWVGAITAIYRNAIDNISDKDKILSLCEELKKYSAREKSTGHINGHDNIIGKNTEWENYQKTENEYSSVDKNKFDEKNEIIINSDNENINVSLFINDISKELVFKIPPKPKKGKPVGLEDLRSLNRIEILERKFNVQIYNADIETSSSFISRIHDEIQKELKVMIKNQESFIKLKPEILEIITPVNLNVQRQKILGDLPDKIIIRADQSGYFVDNKHNLSTIVISLTGELNENQLDKLKKKYNVIISIPPVLFEKDVEKIRKIVNKINKVGIKGFEANSYTGLQIMNDINAVKYLGPDMSVYNHVSARYFYNLGISSVYCPVEGDASMYKAITCFSNGSVECLVYGRLALFQSRVNSPEFINGKIFKDKFCQVECIKQNDMNLFVEKKPFCLIGSNFKKEKIYFDSLTCDLRYFKEPLKVLDNIYYNRIRETSDFNFYRKLV